VDQHFEYSRLIEDIVEVQALSSLRQFYTEDAGYQLAVQVDTSLINCATGFGDGTRTANPSSGADWVNSASWMFENSDTTGGVTAFTAGGTADAFNDEGFREAIKVLDDANVPMDSRYLVILRQPVVTSWVLTDTCLVTLSTDALLSQDSSVTSTV
jgi:hypothetical protein